MRRDPKTPEPVRVLVFARAPVPGRCKTRLIPRYGARGAARLYRALARRILTTALASGFPVELWCEPGVGHGWFLACRRQLGLPLRRQARGDLGRKMAAAIAAALQEGASRVLVVGTDCVALEPRHLQAAAAALQHDDCVVQPADDGGYVLIGARVQIHAGLRRIFWSSGHELRQTLTRLERSGRSLHLLNSLWDVDHARDVRRARKLALL